MNKSNLYFAIMAMAGLVLLSTCKKEEIINPPTVKVFEGAITINYNKANVSAEVTDQGGAEVKSRGFVYGLSGESLDTVFCGNGIGVYSAELNNLQPNTTYVYEAFAKNAGGFGTSGKVTFTTRDNEVPTVKTGEVSEIGITTAFGKGEVRADGGVAVTERGLCWSTDHNPTTSNSHNSAGNGIGNFNCNLTDLTANTTYYVRAYAKNSKGTAYGEEKSFTTMDYDLPQVTTAEVTNITQTTAKGGGEVISDGGTMVIERGVCWNTSHYPTINNNKVQAGEGLGSFTCDITDLDAYTIYYVRAYATNSKGTKYGDEVNFKTSASSPTVSTLGVIHITTTSATGSGKVMMDGGSPVIERGFCWSTNHNPTIGGPHLEEGSGIGWFAVSITGLSLNTTYYARAYATNGVDTSYGEEVEFNTLTISPPGVTTATVTHIDRTSAVGGGNVISDGGAIVTERGICWSTRPNPTISENHQSNGVGTGSYFVNMTGLAPNTVYYVKAYAINEQELIGYGGEVSFQTEPISKPTVTTNYVGDITPNTATCGGNVTNDGGGTILARGVCWSTNPNPTIANQHTTDGIGTGSFTSQIIGLTPKATYHVRAYATNSAGTEYGVERQFTTIPQGVLNDKCKFTINSSGSKVYFSKGNLQYIGNNQTWKFAEQQWQTIGTSQGNSSQNTTRDLFGWGTSGWNCNTYYQPWHTSTSNGAQYGPPGANNLADGYANADWGYRNSIFNGGNQTHQWRTLRRAEWDYVLNQRNTSSGKRYAKARVNGVNGVILLPDDWSTSYYSLNNCNQSGVIFNSNVISSTTWLNSLEAHGAVFLPAAGFRSGNSVQSLDALGYYWSSSYHNGTNACTVYFSTSSLNVGNNVRYNGYSVRLVCPAN